MGTLGKQTVKIVNVIIEVVVLTVVFIYGWFRPTDLKGPYHELKS